MKLMKDEKVLAKKMKGAVGIKNRTLGLMFSKNLGDYDALLLEPCNSIHTCFMRYPIDVLFLNSANEVIKIIRELKPWRFTRMYFKANKVIEMMGGELASDINIGDKLEIVCIS